MSQIDFETNDVNRATKLQIEYIESLSIDLCFDRKQRNAHIKYTIWRPINYLDELTKQEAHKVIELFKKWKEESE